MKKMDNTYIKSYTNTFVIKGHSYTVTAPARFDSKTNELVDDFELDDQAAEKANEMYREEFDLLSPKEIKSFRNRLTLSQRDFAKLIGVSPNTIALYEAGAFPTTAHNRLLKSLMYDDRNLKDYITVDQHQIPADIQNKVEEALKTKSDSKRTFTHFIAGFSKYSALQLANWFRIKNFHDSLNDENVEELTQMKVVKLLYFAFGRYASQTGKELFTSPIIAMQHGPVVEEVHQKFSGNRGIIGEKGQKLDDDAYHDHDLIETDSEVSRLLTEIEDEYGDKTAVELRNITHQPGSPWNQTLQGRPIDKTLILKTFGSHYEM
ncbi:type II toxin-antitoxin system antitoxin SocA domain-containing protein [Secundilactobacillus mixtipabuli]|uniref:HTH cro/C1-type domain-containing protein n=1 Tax=Secundilactobacillus mixtipabuli TaxID=1435342 RepID=A0A1Z5IE75_9LACO|nr:type II toxin-antitoxin system antitoxin SocA domain-containing protein [Secundilactobacillus mixtipabuli]GAX00070.1 hypothetical protein IWT30_02050 [Secundilactobacillus mixtipabuli]